LAISTTPRCLCLLEKDAKTVVLLYVGSKISHATVTLTQR